MDSLGFSIYSILSTYDSFTCFLSVWISFVSCLIDVVRTSSAILNRTGEDRHSCLVPDVSGRVRLFFFVYYFCVFGFGEFLWSYMWLVGS